MLRRWAEIFLVLFPSHSFSCTMSLYLISEMILSSFVTCFCFYRLFSFHWHILRKPALCWESFTLSPHKGSIRVVYRSASILQPFLILSICALKTWSMSRIKKHFFNPLNLFGLWNHSITLHVLSSSMFL